MTQYASLARDLQSAAIQFSALASSASAFGATVNSFRQFERQLTLTGSVAGATAQQFREMEKATRRFALAAVASATESANALYFLASAGFSTAQSLQAMSGVLLFAQATLSDTGQASDIIASNIRAFGLEAKDASRIANVFTATIASSQATIEKLGFALRQVGPVAGVAGQKLEETAAFLGQLFNIGLRGEQAGTALRNIIVRLAAPVGEARDILAQFGIATIDAGGNMRDLESILKDIGAQNFSEEILSKIFGAEALAGGVALIRSVGSEYQKLRDKISNTNKAFEIASKQINTLDGSLKLAVNGANELALSVGEALAPLIRSLAETVISLARSFNALDEDTKELIASFAAVAVGATSLLTVVGFIGPAFLSGVAGIVLMGKKLTELLGILRLFSIVTATGGVVSSLSAMSTGFAAAAGSASLLATRVQFLSGVFLATPIGRIVAGMVAIGGAVGAAAIAYNRMGAEARAAAEAQTQSQIRSLIDTQGLKDFVEEMEAYGQQIESIPFLFQDKGFGNIDAASALSGVIEGITGEIEKADKGFEEAKNKAADLLFKREEAVQALNKALGGGADASFIREAAIANPSQLANFGFTEEQARLLAGLEAEINELQGKTSTGVQRIQNALAARNKILDDFVNEIVDDPAVLGGLAVERQAELKEAFAKNNFAAQLGEALREASGDGSLSGQEAIDTVIDTLRRQDAELANRLKPDTGDSKVLASLRDGLKAFETEVKKAQISLNKGRADTLDDLALALQADNQASLIKFEENLKKLGDSSTKVINDALANFTSVIDAKTVAAITGTTGDDLPVRDLAANSNVFKFLEEAAANGDATNIEETKRAAEKLVEANRQRLELVLDAFVKAKTITETAANEIRQLAELSGKAVGIAVDTFDTEIAKNIEDSNKRNTALIAAQKKAANLRRDLAVLRIESQRTLLEAQQKIASFRSFDISSESARGAEIIELQFQEDLARIEARIDAQSAALGRELSSTERDQIRRRYQEAAQLSKNAAEEELIRTLQETQKRIEREAEDLFSGFGAAALEAKRTAFSKGNFISIDDFVREGVGLDQAEIVQKYRQQLVELGRQQEDLLQKYRGQPEVLANIRTEYQNLVGSINEAAQAELAYTVSFEEQVTRRQAAIDKQISSMRAQSIASANAFEMFSSGLTAAALEYQKDVISTFDLVKNAAASTIDATSTLLGDIIFDGENAVESLKKTFLGISRDFLDGASKNFLQTALSGFTDGGGIGEAFKRVFDPNFLGGPTGAAAIQQTNTTINPQSITALESAFGRALNAANLSLAGPLGQSGQLGNQLDVSQLQSAVRGGIVEGTAKFNQSQAEVAQTIRTFFSQRGYTDTQIAGIAGNVSAESSFNPSAVNPESGAFGLFQYLGSRLEELKQYAQDTGTSIHNLNTQLEFAAKELQTTEQYTNRKLLAIQDGDARGAATAFGGFERAEGYTRANPEGIHLFEQRVQAANAALEQFTGKTQQVAQAGPDQAVQQQRQAQLAQIQLDTAQSQQVSQQLAIREQAIVQKAESVGLTMEEFNARFGAELQEGASRTGQALDQAADSITTGSVRTQNSFNTVAQNAQVSGAQFQQNFGVSLGTITSGISQVATPFLGQFSGIFNTILQVFTQLLQGGGGVGGSNIASGLANALFSSGGGGLFHNGGQIGMGRPSSGFRSAPLTAWSGAPRYHEGGEIFKQNEVPIIGKIGERVLTAEQYAKRNNASINQITMIVQGVRDVDSFRRSEPQIYKRANRQLDRSKEIS